MSARDGRDSGRASKAAWSSSVRHRRRSQQQEHDSERDARTMNSTMPTNYHTLLKTLQRFLSEDTEVINILIGSPCSDVACELSDLLQDAVRSNAHQNLPPMPLKLYLESERESIVELLGEAGPRVDMAFISVSKLIYDYASLSADTVFVAFDVNQKEYQAQGMYRHFGILDQLEWPPSLPSVRRCLHKWMPRSRVYVSPTPPSSIPSSVPASTTASGPASASASSAASVMASPCPTTMVPADGQTSAPLRSPPAPHAAAHFSSTAGLSAARPSPLLRSPSARNEAMSAASLSALTLVRRLISIWRPRGYTSCSPRSLLRAWTSLDRHSPPQACPLHVLVVESCSITAATTIHFCEMFGIWADHALDGKQAIERVSR